MIISNIEETINSQKLFFRSNVTLDLDFRKNQLLKLREIIKSNEIEITQALKKDLGKSAFESYATEIGIVNEEISLHLKKMGSWARQKRVGSSIASFPSKSYLKAEPYGVSLIVSPWNYPFQLAIAPLVGSISAGNCAVIKPSEKSTNTSLVIEKLINNNFDKNYIKVFTGDAATSEELLKHQFDLIFFTGSPRIGKLIMKAAAENLTPVILELGGKSPCIVDEGVNLKLVAKRIIWGKCINAGQTCIAPDYVLVKRSIKNELLTQLKSAVSGFYGTNPKESSDYPRIINEANVIRLQNLMQSGKIFDGGDVNVKEKYISPTLIVDADGDSALMQEEIFGPLLPVISYDTIEEAIEYVRNKPKPLALYLFSYNTKNSEMVLDQISAGGVTINDVIMHFSNPKLPFGGVGNSGFGIIMVSRVSGLFRILSQ
jgi:aldehyde dehydrogenase (NAD+)